MPTVIHNKKSKLKVSDTLKYGDSYTFKYGDSYIMTLTYYGVDADGRHCFFKNDTIEIVKASDPTIIEYEGDEYSMVEEIGTYLKYEADVCDDGVIITVHIPYSYSGNNKSMIRWEDLARQVVSNIQPYRPR